MTGGFRIALLLITTSAISGKPSDQPPQSFPNDVTYEELDSSGLTCNSLDNCQRNRTDDLTLYNCHCAPSCSLLGTCCADSAFRTPGIEPKESNLKCLAVYGEDPASAYMVNTCSRLADDFARDLCLGDGEARNDPFLLVPVTSSLTSTTYKNYFCAACNDDTTQTPPAFWNLRLTGKSELASELHMAALAFDATLRSWTVREGGDLVPVSVSLQIPDRLIPSVTRCRPGVVSECSDGWKDAGTARKCLSSYMAIVVFHRNGSTVRYRNPHCAICNFEDPDDFECGELSLQRTKPGGVPDSLFVGLFSFDEKTKRCRNDMVYDALAGKCRAVRCGRRQTAVDGKCTQLEPLSTQR